MSEISKAFWKHTKRSFVYNTMWNSEAIRKIIKNRNILSIKRVKGNISSDKLYHDGIEANRKRGRKWNEGGKQDHLKIFVCGHGNCQCKSGILYIREISQNHNSVEWFSPDKQNLVR